MDLKAEARREYLRGALWVLPGMGVIAALAVGSLLSVIEIDEDSPFGFLAFQGTSEDARALLIGIAATVITVMALMLGLTVVALQLASTQFSPRLLRNFLQDRPNQLVLAVLVTTFTYCTAGLFTVGVSSGERSESFPRLAVSGALVLMFASLLAIVFFIHHLMHGIQIDAIMTRVERSTLNVLDSWPDRRGGDVPDEVAQPPVWAVAVPAKRSGYVQTVHPETVIELAERNDVVISFVPRVGDHVVAGLPIAWVWRASPERPAPDPAAFRDVGVDAIRIGFERTFEQDAALGIRQLVDVASKALSPAINDPYTAVQSIDRLTVVFTTIARKWIGPDLRRDATGAVRVVAPTIPFDEYVRLCSAQIRRFGCKEPAVVRRLLHMLEAGGASCAADPGRTAVIAEHVRLLLADAERSIVQPADFDIIRNQGAELLDRLAV